MSQNLKSPDAILPSILSTAHVLLESSLTFLRYYTLAGIAVFALCISLIAPAHAQSRAEMIMKNADVDGDGRISRKEWKGPPPRFDHFDADGNGYLTLDELRADPAGARGPDAFQRPGRAMPDQQTRPGAKLGG
jgi:hypothetical protein